MADGFIVVAIFSRILTAITLIDLARLAKYIHVLDLGEDVSGQHTNTYTSFTPRRSLKGLKLPGVLWLSKLWVLFLCSWLSSSLTLDASTSLVWTRSLSRIQKLVYEMR